jgi:hypothetical protein
VLDLDGVKVTASSHATDQALRRVALLNGAGRHGATFWIERTAAKALLAGRRSKRMPRWCVRTPTLRGRVSGYGMIRFVWDEGETAVLLVERIAAPNSWIVITVMAR